MIVGAFYWVKEDGEWVVARWESYEQVGGIQREGWQFTGWEMLEPADSIEEIGERIMHD